MTTKTNIVTPVLIPLPWGWPRIFHSGFHGDVVPFASINSRFQISNFPSWNNSSICISRIETYSIQFFPYQSVHQTIGIIHKFAFSFNSLIHILAEYIVMYSPIVKSSNLSTQSVNLLFQSINSFSNPQTVFNQFIYKFQ